jgi:hypothetical protein
MSWMPGNEQTGPYPPANSNPLTLTDASTESPQHAFTLGPRTTALLAYPVPAIQPASATVSAAPGYAEPCALDIGCGAGATPSPINGLAWIDVVSNEVMSQPPTLNANTLRLGIQGPIALPTFGEVSTRYYGTNSSVPLYIGAAYFGSGNPQIYLGPQNSSTPFMKLGYDGSDVIIGAAAQLVNAATLNFFTLNTMAGAPTGVPAHSAVYAAQMVYDTTNKKIWIWDQPTTTWKGVVVA